MFNTSMCEDKWVSFQAFALTKATSLNEPSYNKKLRYREEHSASIMLSWCICDISPEKIC